MCYALHVDEKKKHLCANMLARYYILEHISHTA